jgi:rSAM-associated Gly-rich repeat protein
MSQDRRALGALAALLPAGVLGLSVSLAAADARAALSPDSKAKKPGSVAEHLQSIREAVSGAMNEMPRGDEPFLKVDPEKRLAWWGNGGWGNWGNGWHNWGNGWNNWGNGLVLPLPIAPWNNWGNGWHNGWHNW